MAQLIVFKQVKSVTWMIVDKEPLFIEVSRRFKGWQWFGCENSVSNEMKYT